MMKVSESDSYFEFQYPQITNHLEAKHDVENGGVVSDGMPSFCGPMVVYARLTTYKYYIFNAALYRVVSIEELPVPMRSIVHHHHQQQTLIITNSDKAKLNPFL